MSSARSGAAAVRLQDGRILITGGSNGGNSVSTADIFDTGGNFSVAPAMQFARSGHTATLLLDGTVLVAGGLDTNGVPTNKAEIFDPSGASWTPAGSMIEARSGHTATLLADGTVLVTGGYNGNQASITLEIYDPGSGQFTPVSDPLSSARENHAAVQLQDGRVLIVGGWDGTSSAAKPPSNTSTPNPLASSDIFDPTTRAVSQGPSLNAARMSHTATLQMDGKIFVVGGNDGTQDLASAEVFDPTGSNSFTLAAVSLTTPRSNHLAILLPHNNGTLIVGGTSNGTALSSAEIYMPVYLSQTETATLTVAPSPMSTARAFAAGSALSDGTAMSMNDGLLLVAGGTDASGSILTSSELYGFQWVKTDALDYSPGTPVKITGGGFQPGETITLHLEETPFYDSHPDLTAVVQSDGTFSNSDFAPDIHDIDIRFFLTATGSQSGLQAQTTFTDNKNVTVAFAGTGSGSVTSSPAGINCTDTHGVASGTCTVSVGNNVQVTLTATATTPSTIGIWNVPAYTINTGCTSGSATCTFTLDNSSQTITLTFNPGPVSATTSTVSASPTSVVADGTSTSTVTVTLKDSGGNVVPGKTVSLTAGSGSSTVTATNATTDANGQASFTVKDGSVESVTYTAKDTSDNTTIAPTATVNFTVGAVSVVASTVSANPSTVVADGTTSSTVTVTLVDAFSHPVSGKTVNLAQGTGHSTISPASATTNSSGVATFTVKDTKAEAVTYTATDSTDSLTITQTAKVTFTAGAVSGTVSTISANPTSVPADNSTTSSITVTLLDANSNPVNGKAVSLIAGSGASVISPASATTNASGVATFTVKDTTVEAVTYSAKDTTDNITLSPTATVNFTVGSVNAGTSTVSSSPSSIVADGVTTSTITVTLLDTSSRGVSGKTVTLTAGSGSSTISAASGPSNSSGVVTFTVKDTKAETVTYTAKDATDNTTITQTAQVTFTPGTPTAGNSTVSANPTSVTADGSTSSTITVTLEDAHNNPVSGKTVTLAQGSGSSTITIVSGSTNASGVATFTVKDTKAEVVTYTATDATDAVAVAQTAQVTFTPGPIAKFVFSAISSPETAGTAFNVTITAEDVNGNTVTSYNANGNNVTITSTGTLSGGTITTASFTNGVLVNQPVTITNVGNFTLTATGNPGHANGITGTSNAFTVNPGSATRFTVSAPASATAGSPINVSVTALDQFGNTATGYAGTVHFTSSDGQALLPANYAFLTGDNGVHLFSVTLKTAGTQTVTAADTANGTINGTSGNISVSAAAAASVIATAGTPQSTVINSAFPINLGATVKDAFGNPVGGTVVTFAVPGSGASGTFAGGVNTAMTNANGIATAAVLTANGTAGSYNVNGSVAGVATPALFALTNNNPAPTLSAINPTSGILTQTLNVMLTGTNFLNAVTSASFGADISVNTVTVNSSTQITVNITIPSTASLGGHTVSVTNSGPGGGTASLPNAFNVIGTPPQITSLNGATFTAGSAGNFTVTSTGTPTPSLSKTGSLPSGVSFTDNGNGTATIAGTTTVAGSFPILITAQNGINPNATQNFTLTVTPAPLASIVLTPASTSITAGGTATFAATGLDQYGNSRGDVTGATTFSVTGGTCAGNLCGGTAAGVQTVTGNDGGITNTAALTVLPGPIAHLMLSPSPSSIAAGASESYTAIGLDVYNNLAGDVTSSTTFTISPDGSCTGANCTANIADTNGSAHAVTGVYSGNGAQGQASLTVTAGNFTQLQILVPGETSAPGTATGKTGTANLEYVNGQFLATVNAVDQYWNIVSSVNDAIQITSNDPKAVLPGGATLASGTGAFPVTLLTVSYNPAKTTLTAADSVTAGIAPSTSVLIPVIIVYTAGITPADWSTGQQASYTLTIRNADAPNTNNVSSIEIAVPQNDQGSTGNISVAAVNPGNIPVNWSYDAGMQPGTMRFVANSANDAVIPGGTVTVTFTATSNAAVASSPVIETWNTIAFSDIASTGALPLAPPEPAVNIGAAPQITSASSTSAFTYQTSGTTFTVTTTGVPTATISISGSFPAWAAFADNQNGTATISGTPTEAGTSTFTITAHNGYGNDATQSFTLNVNKALVTPSIAAADKVYDTKTTANVTCSLSGIVGNDDTTCTVAVANFSSANAGTWQVTAIGITLVGMSSSNYQLSSTTAYTTATITPATPAIMVSGGPFTYDGTPHSASITATGVGGVLAAGSAVFTYTPPGDTTVPINAGTYNVNAMFTSADPNYGNAIGSGAIVIKQAQATVSAADASRSYGEANPTFTGTLAGFVTTDGISATYASAATANTPVGIYGPASAYAIVPTFVDPNNKLANYSVTLTNGSLTISAVPLLVISPDNSRGFGGVDSPLTPTLVGLVAGDTAASVGNPVCQASASASSAPGSYAIVCSGVTSTNYVVTYLNGTLTITDPLSSISVNPNPDSVTYGASTSLAARGAFASSLARTLANAGGESYNLHDLTMSRTGDAAAEAQGKLYSIGGVVSGSPSNTVEVYDSASDSWTAAANLNNARTSARAASVAGKVYVFGGCSDVACTSLVATPEVFDPVTNAWSGISAVGFTPRRNMAVAVLNDKVYVAGGSDSSGNAVNIVEVYDPGKNSWIASAPLLKSLSPASGAVANGNLYVIGINGGSAEIEQFNSGAWSTVNSGTQALTDVSAAVLNNVIYVFDGSSVHAYDPSANSWTDKTALSNSRLQPQAVTIANLIYLAGNTSAGAADPNALEAFASDEAKWSSSDATVSSIDQSGTATGLKVGNTTITATSIQMPTISGNSSLTVNPATLTIKADAETKVYGQSDPALTYSAAGFQFTDTQATVLTGGLARDAGENVISAPGYAIGQGTLAANANYTISYIGNYLTITPAMLTVSADPQTKVYGQNDPTLTYHVTGLQFSDASASVLSGDLSRAPGESVAGSPYAISQGSLKSNANYTISFTGNNLSITPATLTVKANPQSKVYGQGDPALTYQVSGLQFSDAAGAVLSGALTRALGENVAGGPYAISQGTLTSNSNYAISFTGSSLSITPATLTITADAKTKVYGQSDPSLTYHVYGLQFSDTAGSVLSGGLARTPGEDVNTYPISQGSLAANSNYAISFSGAILTITPAPLTVTASSGAMIFGSAPFIVTPMFNGFVNMEGPSNLPTMVACGPAFSNTSMVGSYPTSCTGPALDGNYTLTYVGGNVVVSPANTQTTVSSSLNPSTFMQLVTFTADVTNSSNGSSAVPAGSVTFNDTYNGVTSAICSNVALAVVNGQDQATCSTTTLGDVYPNNIVASFSPNPANFNASSSGILQQVVNPAPAVTLSPLSVSFGNTNVASASSPAAVTLGNAGDAPLLLSAGAITITGPNASDFTLTTTCGSSLGYPPGANTCKINVVFKPSETGVETATLQITDNDDNATNAQQFVSLTGSGLSTITGTSLYTNAIFGTSNACGAITVSGGSWVDSFNSALGYSASKQNAGGSVGTNGNVTLNGSNSAIYGSAAVDDTSTGSCTKSSVPGLTSNGGARVTGGLVPLNGPITYPAPPAANPAPPTATQNISGSCPSGMTGCTNSGSKTVVLAPGQYGNVTASGSTIVHVTKGTYNLNSLTLSGKSILTVDAGPVILNLAGASLNNGSPAIDLSGGSIVNPSHIPANLQFAYGGSHGVNLTGGADSYAVLYAPNALVNMSGGSDFYGSIIGSAVTSSGGTAVHYDANLPNIQSGNYIWFTAVVNNISGLPASQQAKLYLTNATVSFTANGTQYNNLPVPNGVVTFNSSSQAAGAKTVFDIANSRWSTNVAKNGATGNTFVTGFAFPVPANFPTGIQNVTFSAAFSTDTPGITLQWQWNAAVYTQFSTTYAITGNSNVLGVNGEDGAANANGTDPAGTPESYEQYGTFGATGGYFSSASGIVPTVAQVSASPSSLDFGNQAVGQPSNTQQVVLTNNYSTALSISSIAIAGGDAVDFKETDTCSKTTGGFGAGTSCTITVSFAPSYTNFESAKIVITDTANNSPQTVYLSGTGH